jgi:hypothetical protein
MESVIQDYMTNYQDQFSVAVSDGTVEPLLTDIFSEVIDEFDEHSVGGLEDELTEVNEYNSLTYPKKLWITEWGIEPPTMFGNTFADGSFILKTLLEWTELSNTFSSSQNVEFATKQSLLTGGYHGMLNPLDLSGASPKGFDDNKPAGWTYYAKRVGNFAFELVKPQYQVGANSKICGHTITSGSFPALYLKVIKKNSDFFIFFVNAHPDNDYFLKKADLFFKNSGGTSISYTITANGTSIIDPDYIFSSAGKADNYQKNSYYETSPSYVDPPYEISEFDVQSLSTGVTQFTIPKSSFGMIKLSVTLTPKISIEPNLSLKASIRPNPASDFMIIEIDPLQFSIDGIFKLFNLEGVQVVNEHMKSSSHHVNLQNLSAGLYSWEVKTLKGSERGKIVID